MNSEMPKVTNKSRLLKTVSRSPNGVYIKNNQTFSAKCRVERFGCYRCNKTFPSKSEVVVHLKQIHNACASPDCWRLTNFKMHGSECPNRGLGCAVCSKKFSEKFLLFAHFNEHIDAAFFVCDICRKGFQWQIDLQKHLLQAHDESICLPVSPSDSKEVYQKCDQCSKYYRLFAEFAEHVSSCNTSPYACCICQVIFPNLSALDEHKLIEHKLENAVKGKKALRQGKRYFCGICYLGFSNGIILKKHLVTHEVEINFICDVCHANFACDGDLQSHYLKHIEEHYILHKLIIQHSCNSCMKRFKTRKELEDHKMVKCSVLDECNPNAMSMEETSEDNSNVLLELETATSFDTSDVPVYALKSGEELLNCDDSQCVIVMDLVSLFILQRGICASENRMPDMKNSEAYNESDVIDASLLQNHMLQILSGNDADSLCNPDEVFNPQSSIDSPSDQNLNSDSRTPESDINMEESNEDSVKFSVIETESLPIGESEASVNSDNANEAFEFLLYNTKVSESFIDSSEVSPADDLITKTGSETVNKELLMECNEELSVGNLLICNVCKQVFSSRASLCLHIKGSHTGFDCYKCGESFKSEDELKNHETVFHPSLLQCDICDESFLKEHLLRKHKRGHIGGKQFVCGICDKSYAMKSDCDVHMMNHKGITPPTKCEICGKIYSSVSNYMRHKLTHEGKMPTKRYVCNICDKSFAGNIPLQVHVKTHIRKTPFNFECPKCKMYFPLKIMDEHIESHDSTF